MFMTLLANSIYTQPYHGGGTENLQVPPLYLAMSNDTRLTSAGATASFL